MTKGKVDALLGIVFGDEGKGKVVDVFTPRYDVVARFAGGPNAGHTIIFEGKKFVLRSIPSGIFDEGKLNIIGNGCVIAPDLFAAEAHELAPPASVRAQGWTSRSSPSPDRRCGACGWHR